MKFNSEIFKVITPIFVDNGGFFINDLFQRKFNGNAPNFGNHLVSFYKNNNSQYLPLSYTNFLPYKGVVLVGGAMTDGKVIKQMSDDEKKIISDCGGVYLNMLKYAFEYFSEQCDAYFGYVNDPRALEVDLAAGFIETKYQYLVVNYHKPTSNWKKKRLEKMAHHIGTF